MLVVITGVGAGVGAITFMAILHAVQHAAFGYHHGGYSVAASHHSDLRRVAVLTIGGLVTGVALFALRKVAGGRRGADPGGVDQQRRRQGTAHPRQRGHI